MEIQARPRPEGGRGERARILVMTKAYVTEITKETRERESRLGTYLPYHPSHLNQTNRMPKVNKRET